MENIPLGAINPRRWLVLTVVVAARQREIKRGRQGSKEGRRLPNADLQHSHKKLLMGKFAADSEPSASIDAPQVPCGMREFFLPPIVIGTASRLRQHGGTLNSRSQVVDYRIVKPVRHRTVDTWIGGLPRIGILCEAVGGIGAVSSARSSSDVMSPMIAM